MPKFESPYISEHSAKIADRTLPTEPSGAPKPSVLNPAAEALRRRMTDLARRTSPAKANAARSNGRKGGRPRRNPR